MPLHNDKDKVWAGWLVDGLGDQDAAIQEKLVAALMAINIPKATIKQGVLNMWWRPQSPFIDVICQLDGTITATIHIQPFGSHLWVGRAADANWLTDNYYKRMAAQAFLGAVDLAILATLSSSASQGDAHVHVIQDQTLVTGKA
jgi:hypothetical protein